MSQPSKVSYDVASGLVLGRRERQEDAVAADFPVGASHGFAVLADGMGGHDAGDVASRIVVTEVFSELKLQSHAPEALEENIHQTLCTAMHEANLCLDHVSRQRPDTHLMGATLLVPVLFEDRLYWISVGDSPLFLFRDETLTRLNETHSMAKQIDLMHRKGQLNAEEAAEHPDRYCLTSVLAGREIAQIDCRATPFQLRQGDIVLAASDGLEYISEARIAEVVNANRTRQSAEISAALLREIELFDDPQQDNVSFCVIKLTDDATAPKAANAPDAPRSDLSASAGDSTSSVQIMARTSGKIVHLYCISKRDNA